MSDWIEYKVPFIFSSSAEAGATNISADGSSFEVVLDRPLVVPRKAQNVFITVQAASAWWNEFNIKQGVNDQLDVTYHDGILQTTQTITLEPGLYDLDHLSEEIGRELVAVGYPQDLFVLIPNEASQKVVIQFNYGAAPVGVQLDFTVARNFAELIGFDERLVPLGGLTTTNPQFETSDNVAQLNQVDYLLIHSDLVSRGIRINDRYQNIIAQLLINVAPGSQIIDSPFNPPEIPCQELAGESRKNIRFWITDNNNRLLDTKGELFGVRLIIHYYMKMQDS